MFSFELFDSEIKIQTFLNTLKGVYRMVKTFVQMCVAIAVVIGVWLSPVGRKIDAWFYNLQHQNDPAWATNTQTVGYMGDQTVAKCEVQPGYRACSTVEVSYLVLGEGLSVEPHVDFTWNAGGNEANASGSGWVSLTTSTGSTVTMPVITGDNLIAQFDHQYVPFGVSATGFECIQRDAKTWDCR